MARQTQYLRIKNSTGRVITKGAVTHATKDYGIQTITIDGLENDAYSESFEMYSGPTNRDYWWICWSNDGLNWVGFNERYAIKDHETTETPATIELIGMLEKEDLSVCFYTDGSGKELFPLKKPW